MNLATRCLLIFPILAPLLAQAQTHLERPRIVSNLLKDHAPPQIIKPIRDIIRPVPNILQRHTPSQIVNSSRNIARLPNSRSRISARRIGPQR